jgi:hypothetical protein
MRSSLIVSKFSRLILMSNIVRSYRLLDVRLALAHIVPTPYLEMSWANPLSGRVCAKIGRCAPAC